jgi:hypothetical protein
MAGRQVDLQASLTFWSWASQRTIAVQSTIALPQPVGVSSMPKRRTGNAFPWRSPSP